MMRVPKSRFSIDVIVPVTRVSRCLYDIINMEKPSNVNVTYIFIVDKPSLTLPEDITKKSDVIVLYNDKNLGAHASRNKGITVGKGDFILFLDDDVIPSKDLLLNYYEAIKWDREGHPGYVGYVGFPIDLKDRFHLGVKLSLMTTFFEIAKYRREVVWGVTANLMVNRKKLGGILFRTIFPKSGGGEDIDFGIRITRKNGKLFLTIPDAKVTHPVWSSKGRWRRFFRWRYGDTNLILLYPELTFRTPLNFPEFLFIYGILIGVLSVIFDPIILLVFGFSTPLLFLTEFLLTKRMIEDAGLKGYPLIGYVYATIIRLINEFGHLAFIIKHLKFNLLCRRFDYSCIGEFVDFEKKWSRNKFLAYLITCLLSVIFMFSVAR
ncbi:hypothetical protein B6U96_14990 [Archaeoglobales archaeon ex4484_92]|nr:MAG: hypothetical protein B6U96_14990 [Archaeoglobales archaeon ex4484_92]